MMRFMPSWWQQSWNYVGWNVEIPMRMKAVEEMEVILPEGMELDPIPEEQESLPQPLREQEEMV